MDKEVLKTRLKEIEDAIQKQNGVVQQAMANLNMLEGGKQELLFWLAKMDETEMSEIFPSSLIPR